MPVYSLVPPGTPTQYPAINLVGATGEVVSFDEKASYKGLLSTLNDFANTLNTTVTTANEAQVVKVTPPRSLTVTKLEWFTGSASAGNYDVGIYDADRNALWRKGSTIYPATNTAVLETVSPGVAVTAGSPIYLAFVLSDVTAGFRGLLCSFAGQVTADDGSLLVARVGSAFPLPATLATSALAGVRIPHIMLRSA